MKSFSLPWTSFDMYDESEIRRTLTVILKGCLATEAAQKKILDKMRWKHWQWQTTSSLCRYWVRADWKAETDLHVCCQQICEFTVERMSRCVDEQMWILTLSALRSSCANLHPVLLPQHFANRGKHLYRTVSTYAIVYNNLLFMRQWAPGRRHVKDSHFSCISFWDTCLSTKFGHGSLYVEQQSWLLYCLI